MPNNRDLARVGLAGAGDGLAGGDAGHAERDFPHIAVEVSHAAVLAVVRAFGKQVTRAPAIASRPGLAAVGIAIRLPDDAGVIGIFQGVIVVALGKVRSQAGVVPGAVGRRGSGLPMGGGQQGEGRPLEAAHAVKIIAARLGGVDTAGIVISDRLAVAGQAGNGIMVAGGTERIAVPERTGDTAVIADLVFIDKEAGLLGPAVDEGAMQSIASGIGRCRIRIYTGPHDVDGIGAIGGIARAICRPDTVVELGYPAHDGTIAVLVVAKFI